MPLLATAIATPDHLAEHLQDLRLASLARPRDGGLALGIAEAGLGAVREQRLDGQLVAKRVVEPVWRQPAWTVHACEVERSAARLA